MMGCPQCGAAVQTWLTLCARCRVEGWEDGPHHLDGAALTMYLDRQRGERPKMPQGWYRCDDGAERGAAWLRFAAQHLYGARDRAAVVALARQQVITELHLAAWQQIHHITAYAAWDRAFPEYDILPWEMPERPPRSYWETYGDTAIAAAMRWWLDREGVTARALWDRWRQPGTDLSSRLCAAGLAYLVHTCSIEYALRLVDPTLPERPSKRAAWRNAATAVCPWCAARVQDLSMHRVRRHPDRSQAALRAALGDAPLSIAAVRARRSRAASSPRQRGSAPARQPASGVWVRDGLSLAASAWTSEYGYVRLHVDVARRHIILLPAPTGGVGRCVVRRRGHRVVLRLPRTLIPILASMPMQILDGHVVIAVATEEACMPFAIWSKGQRNVSDMIILPRRSALLIKESLWPLDASRAAVARDETGAIGVLPIAADGHIVGSAGARGPRRKAPVPIEACYTVQRNGRRVVLSVQTFLHETQAPVGRWRFVGTHDGFLRFVADGDDDDDDDDESMEAEYAP